ncbi:MAG: toll/interleukin-1 receptor domain-containing protein [Chloroflexota bacterium]
MSHIFISYAHADRHHLDQLLDWFKENDFAEHEIWYDAIEGGDNWRDEISASLDEAYAVLIIITENSMESHYCTYEWSYALGQGIPLIPLLQ